MLVTVVLEGRKNGPKGLISIIELLICRDPLSIRPTLIADLPLLYQPYADGLIKGRLEGHILAPDYRSHSRVLTGIIGVVDL
jgi:hypothetical protein